MQKLKRDCVFVCVFLPLLTSRRLPSSFKISLRFRRRQIFDMLRKIEGSKHKIIEQIFSPVDCLKYNVQVVHP